MADSSGRLIFRRNASRASRKASVPASPIAARETTEPSSGTSKAAARRRALELLKQILRKAPFAG